MNEQQNFDVALRRWAARSPATKASDAARAVVAAIEQPRQRWLSFSPASAIVAAATIALAVGAAVFVRTLPAVDTAMGTTAATANTNVAGPSTQIPSGDADLVMWLDDGTPVYVFLPDTQAMR